MNNILLLEDEENINRGISIKLEKEGYRVFSTDSIANGMNIFKNNNIDLIICDIMLADGSGISFCKQIRQISKVHFIFLTALDQEVDIVMGYEIGADDYITKPFSLTVLISKVNAIFKRIDKNVPFVIESGEITVNLNEMKVYVSGAEVLLTKNEIKLIIYFLDNPKHILSKNQILENVFDMNGEFADENTVAVNIRRLREKIEVDASNPKYIKNIRGLGYIWDKECNRF